MPIRDDPKCDAIDVTPSVSARDRSDVYAALYGLNSGIHQVLNSIDFLDKSDLGLPFLNGYRILADEIRSGINFTTAEALSIFEIRGYREREQQAANMSISSED
jgi:hypothetical protein